ncbi:MAG: NTP transferase domain-containing protein, partial [Rubrobacter sp.]|nr:NTP transferase domain-containing protein [Rubrobacter sp.]
MTPPRKASGLLLAGGQSRRMGRDKLSLEVGGVPLIR